MLAVYVTTDVTVQLGRNKVALFLNFYQDMPGR